MNKETIDRFDEEYRKMIINNIENCISTEFYCENNLIWLLNKFFSVTNDNINIFCKSLYDIEFQKIHQLFKSKQLLPINSIKIITTNNTTKEDQYFKDFFKDNYVVDYHMAKYNGDDRQLRSYLTFDDKIFMEKFPGMTGYKVSCYNPIKVKELNNKFNEIYQRLI